MKNNSGRSFGFKDVDAAITQNCMKYLEQNGFIENEQYVRACKTTVVNYTSLIANEHSISIARSFTSKTTTIFAAENSIISAMSFMFVVATTQFVLVNEQDH